MRTVVIKRIGVLSTFKFFGSLFLVLGLVFGLFSGLIMSYVNLPALSSVPVMSKLTGGILAGVVSGIIYAIAGGIIYMVLAVLYNVFAAIVGGIKIDIEE